MTGLPYAKESMVICQAISKQYQKETDGQTDRIGTVCLQKSCCAIRNIVLKDILRHSCLIAVTRPSDRYLTSASAAFCRHTWRSINVLIITIINISIASINVAVLMHDKNENGKTEE